MNNVLSLTEEGYTYIEIKRRIGLMHITYLSSFLFFLFDPADALPVPKRLAFLLINYNRPLAVFFLPYLNLCTTSICYYYYVCKLLFTGTEYANKINIKKYCVKTL